jgi:hypothetical protein
MSRTSAIRPVRRRRRLRSAPSTPAKPKPPASRSVPLPEPKQIVPDVWYNEAETAPLIRLKNPKTLTVWRCRGEHPELRYKKPYGRVLYKGSDIIAFLEGTAVAPETPKRKQ